MPYRGLPATNDIILKDRIIATWTQVTQGRVQGTHSSIVSIERPSFAPRGTSFLCQLIWKQKRNAGMVILFIILVLVDDTCQNDN